MAERYYQSSVQADREARSWLVGGELALVGTLGLFVWELSGPRGAATRHSFRGDSGYDAGGHPVRPPGYLPIPLQVYPVRKSSIARG